MEILDFDDSVIGKRGKIMYKKILTLITSTLLCLTLMSPVQVKAEEAMDAANTTESSSECASNKDEIRRKNEELYQKWNALTEKQKADVYKSVKGTIDAQAKFLDKLVKYDLISKEDAKMIKDDMYAKFEEMQANDALFQGKPKAESQEKRGTTDQNKQNTPTPTPTNPPASTNPGTTTNPGTSANPGTTTKPTSPNDTNKSGH